MKSMTHFIVNAKSPKMLLNALKDIELIKVKISGNSLSFFVKRENKDVALEILEQLMYNDFVCDDITFLSFIRKNTSKIVGILLFFIISLTPFFFTAGVSVNTDDKDVLKVVEKYDKIMLKQNVDLKQIEDEIFEIDGVSFCEVSIASGKIEVFVKGSFDAEKPTERFELTSNYEGEITKIITLSGTPKVSVGDRVNVGQILISGVIEVENKEDKKVVNAIGEVYGIAEKVDVFNIPKTEIVSTRTGNSARRNSLDFFGLTIGRKPPFEEYEKVSHEYGITNGYFLPISVKSSTYYEIIREIIGVNLTETQEYLKNLVKIKEEESGGRVISQDVEVVEYPQSYVITVRTKTERNFC